ncbi:hypothetical protein QBC43DRAFT_283376 [Cladorrhinum sp. PSN259]|nr:hypothetical protein QBC43DRAFT_283376 [Cladorrhinum sp. PSN259]
MDTSPIPHIITSLTQQKWVIAFEAIPTLPNSMHPHHAKTCTFDDLHHINTLFDAIMHHHAYGIDEQADNALNQLLLRALQTCQALKASSTPSSQDDCSEAIYWSTPPDILLQEHLEFYRAVLHYFFTFSSDPSGSLVLLAAKRMLQQLSPRINNLSTWNPKTTQTPSSQQKRREMIFAVHSARATTKQTSIQNAKKEWSSRLRSRQSGGGVKKTPYLTPSPSPSSSGSPAQRRKLRPRRTQQASIITPQGPNASPLTQSGDRMSTAPSPSPSYESTGEYVPTATFTQTASSTAASSVVLMESQQAKEKCIEVGGSVEDKEQPDWVEEPTLLLGSERRRDYFLGLELMTCMDMAVQEQIAEEFEKDNIVVASAGGDGCRESKSERKHSVDMERFRLRPVHLKVERCCGTRRSREGAYKR